MFKRKGFTLLELIIVVIIIGVLAGIAIPQYLNAVERAKVAKAKANLMMVSQAEKMYQANESTYTVVTDAASAALLDLYVQGVSGAIGSDNDWGYTVAAVVDIKEDFLITAARNGGAYNTLTLTLDEKGSTAASTHPLK